MVIPDWVEQYIGIPYVEQGNDVARAGGLDCWGLLMLIWREHYGRELPVYEGPHWKNGASEKARQATAEEIGAAINREVARYLEVKPGEEREGDGILLRLRGYPLHIGLVVTPGWMIHVHETAASCIEDYRGMTWSRRVLGFRRYV